MLDCGQQNRLTHQGNQTMECPVCKSNMGEKRISPGPAVYEGDYWFVEHAYPIKKIGWMVIVLKRHAEALHELTAEEFTELGKIQSRLTRLLFEELHCEKEYSICFGEAENFAHIHFHVFAKPHGFPEELKGGKSFALLKVSVEEAVPSKDIIAFCQRLKNRFESQMV